LIDLAREKFKPSKAGGNRADVRTSFSAYLGKSSSVVVTIEKRLARLTNMPVSHVEELQVVRYTPGQFYRAHHDDSEHDPNPRRYTVLIYLKDVEGEGGETEFTELNFKIKPKCGAAVFWENFTPSRRRHISSKHQGLPPKTGVKVKAHTTSQPKFEVRLNLLGAWAD
jgi:prolyl 4-hydroxylase